MSTQDSDVATSDPKVTARRYLHRVLASAAFVHSKRASEFLRVVVEHALAEQWDELRERALGAELFGRPIDYDTANDAVVRVKATEVRRRLREYYQSEGAHDALRIVLPPGSYVPVLNWSDAAVDTDSGAELEENTAKDVLPVDSGVQAATLKQQVAVTQVASASPRSGWSKSLAAMGAVCVAALLSLLAFWMHRSRASAAEPLTSIAVLPFSNLSSDKTQDYFADGLTDELIASLGQISALHVVSRTSSSTYKFRHVSMPQVHQELGVSAVLEGSVQHDAQRVVITVRLVDADKDRQIWSHTYTRDRSDLLTLEGDIAQALARQVQVQVTASERHSLSQRVAINEAAQDDYLRALELLAAGDSQQALEYLKRTVAEDPRYAQAHATLALTYSELGWSSQLPQSVAYGRSRQEAMTAEALDEGLADAHVALAQAAADLDWDWATEQSELKRALVLNPSSAAALWGYANLMSRFGDFDSAAVTMKRAISLDPISNSVYVEAALLYHLAKRNDAAMAMVTLGSTRLHKDIIFAFPLGLIYLDKAMWPQAIEQFRRLGSMPPGLAHLGYAFARNGQVQEAEQILAQLQTLQQTKGTGFFEEATVYMGLGRKEEAVALLEQAYLHHDKSMQTIKVDSCFDTLHSDPRFQRLLDKMKLNLVPPIDITSQKPAVHAYDILFMVEDSWRLATKQPAKRT